MWSLFPAAGSLIATTSASADRNVLPYRTPARIVDELEQEEVREQQEQEAGVAVDEANQVVPGRSTQGVSERMSASR